MSILTKIMSGGTAARTAAPEKCRECARDFDETRRNGARLADAYGATIDTISANLCGLPVGRLKEYQRQLAALREMIVPLLPQKGLQLLRKDLDKLLQSYRDEFDSCLSGREQQTRESMAALAVLAELMSDREPAYRPRFRGISKKLLRLAATPDIETIHQTLLAEIRQLSRYADEAEGANQLAVGRVNV
jgi:hypothetical protein